MQNLFLSISFLATMGAIIPSLILGGIVFFRGTVSRSLKNIFLASSCAIVLWSTINYISITITEHVIWWARLVLFAAVIEQFLFFLLVHLLTHKEMNLKNSRVIASFVLAIITMVATLTPAVFRSVEILNHHVIPVTGPLMPLFGLTVLAFFILGGIEIIQTIRKSVDAQKQQLFYVATGYFLMFTLLIATQFILASVFHNTSFIKFGALFTLPFLSLAAYAIFRHNLFNIRILATELFTALVMMVFFINIFSAASIPELILNVFLFIMVVLFGILLVRGTVREIHALQELSEQKSAFISIASHQLRTPLTALKGYFSLLREGSYGKVDSKQLEVVNKSYRINEGMIRLVNDFLNLSRAERGALRYVFEKVDLRDMIDTIVGEFILAAREKNLELHWQKPSKEVMVHIDIDKFWQVASNLLDNAIKYTEKGGVSVRLVQENGLSHVVRLYVSDTGIGVDPDEASTIFESFTRGKRGERINAKGAGLGLHVAKLVVEGHGGHIWVESRGAGTGSTFIVELPDYETHAKQVKPSDDEQKLHN